MTGVSLNARPGTPVVTPHSQTVAFGQQVAGPSLATVAGSGITEYRVWFSAPRQGFPALGTLTNNGSAVAQDQWVTVSSLGGLEYTGSATAGTDKIFVEAFNGQLSNDAEVDITDPGVNGAKSSNLTTVADTMTTAGVGTTVPNVALLGQAMAAFAPPSASGNLLFNPQDQAPSQTASLASPHPATG